MAGFGAGFGMMPTGAAGLMPGEWQNLERLRQNTPMPQPKFGLLDRIKHGFGRLNQGFGERMFPMLDAESSGMSPEQIDKARKAARTQAGMQLLTSIGQGRGFGQNFAEAFGGARGSLEGAMQRSYQNARENRAEQRDIKREDREIARDDRNFERTLKRDAAEDSHRAATLAMEKTQTEIAAVQAKASAARNYSEAAAARDELAELQRRNKRIEELLKKDTLTTQEELELEVMAGGSPSALTRARASNPFASMGGFGTPGFGGPAANPLLADPDL